MNCRTDTDVINRISIERAIEYLSKEDRAILHLWIWKDMSSDDIGVVIGNTFRQGPITGGAIRYRIKKIKRILRELLDDSD
jgi:hypothetical protein